MDTGLDNANNPFAISNGTNNDNGIYQKTQEGLLLNLTDNFKKNELDFFGSPEKPNGKRSASEFDDDEDLGPETDVDAVDDVLMSPSIAAAKAMAEGVANNNPEGSFNPFMEHQEKAALEIDLDLQKQQTSEFDGKRSPREETPTPPADAVHDVSGLVDNVAESGDDSEDEWNYFKGEEANKENINPEQPEREVADIAEDDSMSQLNPNAAEFVPVSPTRSIPSPACRALINDHVISQSPRRQPANDIDINLPNAKEFEKEVKSRPSDVDAFNGHDDESDLNKSSQEPIENLLNGKNIDEIPEFTPGGTPQKPPSDEFHFGLNAVPFTPSRLLDQSETASSTRAVFGDESTATLGTSFNESVVSQDNTDYIMNKESDPMSMSFYQDKDSDENPFDLNKVQMLPENLDDFLMKSDENPNNTITKDVNNDDAIQITDLDKPLDDEKELASPVSEERDICELPKASEEARPPSDLIEDFCQIPRDKSPVFGDSELSALSAPSPQPTVSPVCDISESKSPVCDISESKSPVCNISQSASPVCSLEEPRDVASPVSDVSHPLSDVPESTSPVQDLLGSAKSPAKDMLKSTEELLGAKSPIPDSTSPDVLIEAPVSKSPDYLLEAKSPVPESISPETRSPVPELDSPEASSPVLESNSPEAKSPVPEERSPVPESISPEAKSPVPECPDVLLQAKSPIPESKSPVDLLQAKSPVCEIVEAESTEGLLVAKSPVPEIQSPELLEVKSPVVDVSPLPVERKSPVDLLEAKSSVPDALETKSPIPDLSESKSPVQDIPESKSPIPDIPESKSPIPEFEELREDSPLPREVQQQLEELTAESPVPQEAISSPITQDLLGVVEKKELAESPAEDVTSSVKDDVSSPTKDLASPVVEEKMFVEMPVAEELDILKAPKEEVGTLLEVEVPESPPVKEEVETLLEVAIPESCPGSTPKSVADTESVATTDVNSFLERSELVEVTSPLSPPQDNLEPAILNLIQESLAIQTDTITKEFAEPTIIVSPSEEVKPVEEPEEVPSIVETTEVAPITETVAAALSELTSKVEEAVKEPIIETVKEPIVETVKEPIAVPTIEEPAVKAGAKATEAKTTKAKPGATPAARKSTSRTSTSATPKAAAGSAKTTPAAKPSSGRLSGKSPVAAPKTGPAKPATTTAAPKPAARTALSKPKTTSTTATKSAAEKKPLLNGDVKPTPKPAAIKKSSESTTMKRTSEPSATKTTARPITASKPSPTKTSTTRPATAPAKTDATKPAAAKTMSRPTNLAAKASSSTAATSRTATSTTSKTTTSTLKPATSPTKPTPKLKPASTTAPKPRMPLTKTTKGPDDEKQIKESANKLTASRATTTTTTKTGTAAGRTMTTTRKTETKTLGNRLTVSKTTTTTTVKSAPTAKKPQELTRNVKAKTTKVEKPKENGITTVVTEELTIINNAVNNGECQLVKDNSPVDNKLIVDSSLIEANTAD